MTSPFSSPFYKINQENDIQHVGPKKDLVEAEAPEAPPVVAV
jgi:hypothetical protein